MIDLASAYEVRDVLDNKVIDSIIDEFGNIWYESFKPLIASGVPPITLQKCKGVDLIDYKIYGNSIQNGTPTPDNPIEIQSVGDLVVDKNDANYGKYKIPVKVNGNVTNIYLKEPLRKIRDYADYIDFENGKVVRNVVEGILDGSEGWNSSAKRYYYYNTELNIKCLGNGVAGIKSNALPSRTWNEIRNSGTGIATYTNGVLHNRIDIRADNLWSTVDEAKEYLANNPIQYIAPALNPTEETIELPTISTNEGTNIIEVDTNILPSNMEVEYYGKENNNE